MPFSNAKKYVLTITFIFEEYLDVVGNALASYKKQCQQDIAIANNRLDKMVQREKGRKRIGKLFKYVSYTLCQLFCKL